MRYTGNKLKEKSMTFCGGYAIFRDFNIMDERFSRF